MTHRVVITGMGCISPLGNTAAETWSAAVSGRSGIGRITHFDTTGFDTQIAAEVKGFDPVERFGRREARRMDRFSQLALTATDEALKDSGLTITEDNCERIGVYIGTGIGGLNTCSDEVSTLIARGPSRVGPLAVPLMLPDSAAGQVAITYGIRGPNLAIISACATGNNVIGEAFESIRAGRVDAMIAGGAEAAIVPVAFASFNAMTALSKRNGDPTGASRPFDKNRDGFVMGEGAAIVILESETHARARGARILAEIVGYGLSNDAFHISAPREDGAGAVSCMRGALREAGLDVTQIDYLNAHGTSTQLNDKAETIAIKRLFGDHAYEVPISSTKSMTGHLLGAAGAVEAQMCINVIQNNLLPPTINYETPDPICDLDYVPNTARAKTVNHAMSNSFGFGGHNACLIFARYTSAANGHA